MILLAAGVVNLQQCPCSRSKKILQGFLFLRRVIKLFRLQLQLSPCTFESFDSGSAGTLEAVCNC